MSIDSFEASRKRSDEIRADLPIHPEKYTMLTGDRPTGRLHMGHYFGTIRERVALQDMGITTRIIIADYQVITDRDTTEHIQDNVYNMWWTTWPAASIPRRPSSSRIRPFRR